MGKIIVIPEPCSKDVALDNRPNVRLWDKQFNCIACGRVPDGQRPIDVAEQLFGDRDEANVTIDWPDGRYDRWVAYFYRDGSGIKHIDHADISRLLEWPQP